MRLTILAGLITGAALGVQATLSAHMRAKAIPANRAIRIRVIAPWYMAAIDKTGARVACGAQKKNEEIDSSREMLFFRSS